MSPAAMANTDLDTNPVGSGPYTLVEYRDSEVAIYERNPDYWNPDFVGPAGLEIYYFPDSNTRLNALRTGQVDGAVVGVELIDEVEGMDDLNVDVYDTIETYHFQPDRTKSEFGDPLGAPGAEPLHRPRRRRRGPHVRLRHAGHPVGRRGHAVATSTTSATRRPTTSSGPRSCWPRPGCPTGSRSTR